MEKIRVFELARKLDTNSKRLMEKLSEVGVVVKNHMSFLEDHELDALYKHIGVRNVGKTVPATAAAQQEAAAQSSSQSGGEAPPPRPASSPSGSAAPAASLAAAPDAAPGRAESASQRPRAATRDERSGGDVGASRAGAGSRAPQTARSQKTGAAGAAGTPEGAHGGAGAAKDARDASRAQRKDIKSAPRIIRTTEVNLDKKAREESRAQQQQQQQQQQGQGGRGSSYRDRGAGAPRGDDRRPQTPGRDQYGGGRGGARRDRGGRGRDGRGRDPGYRSDLVRAPDTNSGLMAGFTRSSREKTIDQLIAEAKLAAKLRQKQEAEAVARTEREAGERKTAEKVVSADSASGAASVSTASISSASETTVIRQEKRDVSSEDISSREADAGTASITPVSDSDAGASTIIKQAAPLGADAVDKTGSQESSDVTPAARSGGDAQDVFASPSAKVASASAIDATIASEASAAEGGVSDSATPGIRPDAQGASQISDKAIARSGARVTKPDGQPDPSRVVVVVPPSQKPLPTAPKPLPQRDPPPVIQRSSTVSAQGSPHTRQRREGSGERRQATDGRPQRPADVGRSGGRYEGGYRADGRQQSRASFDGRPDGAGRHQDGTWHADGALRPQSGSRQTVGGSSSVGGGGYSGGAARQQERGSYGSQRSGGQGYSSGQRSGGGGGYGAGARPSGGAGYGGGQRQGQGGASSGQRPAGGYGGGGRPAGASFGGQRQGQGFAASTRPGAPRPDSRPRTDDSSVSKIEQKREYIGRDSDRMARKDQKRSDTSKTAAAATQGKTSRRFRPEVGALGEKKGVHEILDDDFIINEFYSSDDAKRGKKQRQRRGARRDKYIPPRAILTSVKLPGVLTVKELAEALKKTSAEVIKKLMLMGMMAGLNDAIDFETCALVAEEFGINAEQEVVVSEEDILFDDSEAEEDDLESRPPIVVVMGHVDHGKTSLLDAIRKTNVTAGEAGGITQHIGAYMVSVGGKSVTFLDTPGHEAFTSMRQRGAMVTDIAILVISAVDGVMPQTIEAINHAKAANVSVIVAINMMDRDGANPDRVKQELTEHGLVVDEWGGDVIAVPVSAKTREGIDQLLEMVTLTADMLELKASPTQQAKGTVIEAKLDKSRGPVATLLVQRGTLNVGDSFITGSTVGRIRAMISDRGSQIKSAGPSTPVEIIGLSEVPGAGEVFYVTKDEKVARSLAEKRRQTKREEELRPASRAVSLDDYFKQSQEGKVKDLNLIVKADVQGSVEAVRQALERLGNEEARVNIIHGGVGSINESDVSLASVSNAIIIGFNVRPGGASVTEAADDVGVDLRLYTVIYNAIEDIEAALRGMLAPTYKEVVLGHVEVRQIFKASGVGTIGGCYVLDGKIGRGNSIRLIRDGVIVHEGKLASLKRFKDDVREAVAGFECGISLERFNDIKERDIIEPYMMEEVRA